MSDSSNVTQHYPDVHQPSTRGRVAQVLSDRDVLINLGRRNKVTAGMKFAILADHTEVFDDPEAGEPLEPVEQLKIRVQAIQVRERSTICRTYEKWYRPGRPSMTSMLSMSSALIDQPPEEGVQTISDPDSDRHSSSFPTEAYVKINDMVRMLTANEEIDEGR